jgi:glycosyltransferase involved in cell wall biosynthesis
MDESQRGGAYLRNKSIIEIYEKLGFKVEVLYRNKIFEKKSLWTFLSIFLFGAHVRSLFSKAEIYVPKCDFIHLDNLRMFRWELKGHQAPLIFNAHNLESEIYFSRSKKCPKRFMKYEAKQIRKSYITFVCSEREKNVLLNSFSDLKKTIFVLPNLVDKSDYFSSSDNEKKIISFIGSLNYGPNISAVRFLCENLFPSLSDEDRQRFDFLVAGIRPCDEVRDLLKISRIELRENLSDIEIRKLHADTLISLIPLSEGSGTRLKVLEAAYSGALILATPLGREGISGGPIIEVSLDNFVSKFHEIKNKRDQLDRFNHADFDSDYDLKTWYRTQEKQLADLFSII